MLKTYITTVPLQGKLDPMLYQRERADAPTATLGAYLCAVRTMLLHRSYPALQATERGSSRGNLSPLTLFCFLLQEQKEGLRGERY